MFSDRLIRAIGLMACDSCASQTNSKSIASQVLASTSASSKFVWILTGGAFALIASAKVESARALVKEIELFMTASQIKAAKEAAARFRSEQKAP